ncbi:uncharacterized protein NFIA_009320 [Aspergillus fischeri NRRL 181]|uniref:Uncharacterized protein n=1 Tax=Neosartorya fischeri (strain ATCC 1020 / DSM 3700 / CBS 544.65 / FGSC A1164 / JCM 1740 / NRRL 181 / WB 181) TaxID=331117 RepID=A1D1G0_NEOFI|nr:uncharacterized protein NFIA_009320 [Aspergillus fischeri NRRL 181]EAW22253.1 hypothetical protein NFIA_009320 [Aspergillus fischeri NRRL 181]
MGRMAAEYGKDHELGTSSKHGMSTLSHFVLTGWVENGQENMHNSCLLYTRNTGPFG